MHHVRNDVLREIDRAVISISDHLRDIVDVDELGEKLVGDQVLVLVEGLLRQVRAQVFQALPEEDTSLGNHDEETR